MRSIYRHTQNILKKYGIYKQLYAFVKLVLSIFKSIICVERDLIYHDLPSLHFLLIYDFKREPFPSVWRYYEILSSSDFSTFAFLVDFPILGLLSGNFFLIVPFPDHCLLLPFDDFKVNHLRHLSLQDIPFYIRSLLNACFAV